MATNNQSGDPFIGLVGMFVVIIFFVIATAFWMMWDYLFLHFQMSYWVSQLYYLMADETSYIRERMVSLAHYLPPILFSIILLGLFWRLVKTNE